jgi:hypothetical protein
MTGPVLGPIMAFDAASRLRLQSFAFKLLLVIPVSIAFAAERNYPILGALAYFCSWYSLFCGLAAIAQRQNVNAGFLTAWDELAAFLGVAVAARFLGAVIG